MKLKILIVCLVTCIPFFSTAQSLQIGVEAGASYSSEKISFINSYVNKITKQRINARFGIPVNFSFGNSMKFNSGLFYKTKGINDYPTQNSQTKIISFSSIEIPLILTTTKSSLKKDHFYAGFGPYISLGVNGQKKSLDQNSQKSEKVLFGNKPGVYDLRPLEYGIQLQTGIELKNGVFCKLILQKQLNNQAIKVTNTNTAAMSQIQTLAYLGLTVGYLINLKK